MNPVRYLCDDLADKVTIIIKSEKRYSVSEITAYSRKPNCYYYCNILSIV